MQDPINSIDPSGLFLIAPPFIIVPIQNLPKPSVPTNHDPTLLEKSAYLLKKDSELPNQKLKDQNFDNFWDNVILKKENSYNHITCPGT